LIGAMVMEVTFLPYICSFCGDKNKANKYLLAIAPLLDETTFTAETHIDFISATLESYKRSFEDIEAIVADNCPLNIKIANILKVPMVGCASHRLNLDIKTKLEPYEGKDIYYETYYYSNLILYHRGNLI
jgi:hypothetical protein